MCVIEAGDEKIFQLKAKITYPKESSKFSWMYRFMFQYVSNISVMTVIRKSFDSKRVPEESIRAVGHIMPYLM